ncbi:MAG: hypothetical protein A2010_07200 [Nitrospirae bacterium GWD2_57_9]|nr:MAG: hypothetical protein A2010_07200 [Nitrospirae bacterium GWD2_57_9]OGW50837.1 MAG: hypothetical protein A2078_15575 [Nitrospirae bacterium GWC2_57_9]
MTRKIESDPEDRLRIQEKALQNLADKLKKGEDRIDGEMEDVLEELKAIKLFLSRTMPDFKKQYPDIRKKLKAA